MIGRSAAPPFGSSCGCWAGDDGDDDIRRRIERTVVVKTGSGTAEDGPAAIGRRRLLRQGSARGNRGGRGKSLWSGSSFTNEAGMEGDARRLSFCFHNKAEYDTTYVSRKDLEICDRWLAVFGAPWD